MLGASLGQYVLWRSNGYQTEAFALFPTALVLWIFSRRVGLSVAIWVGVWGGLLWLLKEPFAVTYAMALVLMIRYWQQIPLIVIAVLIAALTVITVLGCAGIMSDYVTWYLPEMFTGRVVNRLQYHDFGQDLFYAVATPGWLKGLAVRRIAEEFLTGGFLWTLGLPLVVLTVKNLAAAAGTKVNAVLGNLLWIVVLVLMDRLFVGTQVVTILGHIPWRNELFMAKGIEVASLLTAVVLIAGILIWRAPRRLIAPLAVVATVYTVTFTAGLGGFQTNHVLFAIPCLLALLIRSRSVFSGREMIPVSLLVGVGLPTVVAQVSNAVLDPDVVTARRLDEYRADQIDAVMTACGIERYMIADATLNGLQGMTRHSPFQLEYGLSRSTNRSFYQIDQAANPLLRAKFLEDWLRADLVLMSESPAAAFRFPEVQSYFERHFVETVVECAHPFLQRTTGVRFNFRKR